MGWAGVTAMGIGMGMLLLLCLAPRAAGQGNERMVFATAAGSLAHLQEADLHASWPEEDPRGYCVGNFGIAAEVSPAGRLLSRVVVNPPVEEGMLTLAAEGGLRVSVEGNTWGDWELLWDDVHHLYPQYHARTHDARLGGLGIEVDAWAPMSVGDEGYEGFLPAIVATLYLSNTNPNATVPVSISYELLPSERSEEIQRPVSPSATPVRVPHGSASCDLPSVENGTLALTLISPSGRAQPVKTGVLSLTWSGTLNPGAQTMIHFLVTYHHQEGYYAKEIPTSDALIHLIVPQLWSLRQKSQRWVDSLPRLPNVHMTHFVRWYMGASIINTKGVRGGLAWSMGYTELNQRDSFWASWIHLVYWPSLSQKMIRESIQFQRTDGKVPTTVLPIIERNDDVDTNMYFVLRIWRYWEWYRDFQFLKETWPAVVKAVRWLLSRDREHIGLPMAVSYWADWLDVRGFESRTYAPHWCLLWLAVLERSAQMADVVEDFDVAREMRGHLTRATEIVNREYAEGGLWRDGRYVDRWAPGKGYATDYTYTDQSVGPLFGVVPLSRVSRVLDSLYKCEGRMGTRDVYPFIDGFPDYAPGVYANGGVYPWLNAVYAWSLYRAGLPHRAEDLFVRLGHYDLERNVSSSPPGGTYFANEFLHGVTGDNEGQPIQAWNGAWFGTMYFGRFGLQRVFDERDNDTSLYEMVLWGVEDRIDTSIVLPAGIVRLKTDGGTLYVSSKDAVEAFRLRVCVRTWSKVTDLHTSPCERLVGPVLIPRSGTTTCTLSV